MGDLELNLILPEAEVINNPVRFVYTPREWKEVLIIYDNYLTLSKIYPLLLLDLDLANQQIDNLDRQRKLYQEALDTCEKDRKFIYSFRDKERRTFEAEQKKGTLKLILVSGGTALVGVAVGIIIGFFAM